MRETLIPFFEPHGVAIIGASQNPDKLSNGIVRNMISYGYEGDIYPVNPKASEINGLKCFNSVTDIPDQVDLAVIILPSKYIAKILHDCGKKGVKAVTVISGGFKEVGHEGQALELALIEIIDRYKMRMIGPNCVGTINLITGMNTTFIRGVPAKGGIGFISQSGAVCGGVVDHIANKGIGFSHFLSLGNMADVCETDMIEYLAEDKDTTVIAVYMEGVRNGRKFIDVCRKVTHHKPIVVLKAGQRDEGAKAVSSHTGSLAGSHTAYQAAFKQSGVIEVFSVTDLLNVSMALDWASTAEGNKAVIVTNSGGPAALASDSFAKYGVTLANLSNKTQQNLKSKLNPAAQVANPVDMLGGANEDEYKHALITTLNDENVDMALAILVPTSLVDPVKIAQSIIYAKTQTRKPIIVCLMGFEAVQDAVQLLHKNKIPTIDFPEKSGVIFTSLQEKNKQNKENGLHRLHEETIEKEKAKDIIKQNVNLKHWGEHVTRDLLDVYHIPVVEGKLASNKKEALSIAKNIEFPVVLKGASKDVLHKSDADAVAVNIKDEKSLINAYDAVTSNILKLNKDAVIDGILIEKMAQPGKEVIIGMKRDPSFGPVIMFGMGGVFVELFKDVAFRVAPLSSEDIFEMVQETAAYKLLNGWRGGKKYDIDAIVDVIQKMSQFAIDFPKVNEIEINPLRVFPDKDGALALDCRMIME